MRRSIEEIDEKRQKPLIASNASLFEKRGDPWGDPPTKPPTAPLKMTETIERIERYRKQQGLSSKLFIRDRLCQRPDNPELDQYTKAHRAPLRFTVKPKPVEDRQRERSTTFRLAQARLKANLGEQQIKGRKISVPSEAHHPSQLEMNTDRWGKK